MKNNILDKVTKEELKIIYNELKLKEQYDYCDQSHYLCKNCPKYEKCKSPVKGVIKE